MLTEMATLLVQTTPYSYETFQLLTSLLHMFFLISFDLSVNDTKIQTRNLLILSPH